MRTHRATWRPPHSWAISRASWGAARHVDLAAGELAAEAGVLSPAARLFWATGLCGGFTTMSTFVYELSRFAQDTEYWLASGYFALTLAGCALAFWAGTLAVRLLALKG